MAKMARQNKGKRTGQGRTLRSMISYMRPWRNLFIVMCLFSLVGAGFSVLSPLYMRTIADAIARGFKGQIDMGQIRDIALLSLFVIGVGFACNAVTSLISPTITNLTAQKMREDINDKANRIPLDYFDTHPEGETLSTMVNDIDTLATSIGRTLPNIMSAVTTFIGCIFFMFTTNIILAVTTVVSTIVGMAITVFIMQKGSPHFANNQAGLAEVNSLINEDIKGHLVIKSFNAEEEVIDAFRKSNRDLYESTWKSQFFSSLMSPAASFASNLGYIAVVAVGAVLAMSGLVTVGVIIAFIQFAQLFSQPLSTLAQAGGSIQPALAAGERVFALLSLDEMSDEGTTQTSAKDVTGTVDFEHVRFGYVPEKIIVKDFSLNVRPGQKVAIVGPTGAGKSTLVNLLMRFYELNSGSIRIDGVPVSDMPRETLHSLISMVLQDTWTFEGSIRDNIVYATEGVTQERFDAVCQEVGLSEFLETFANGADTILGEESGISAGQKQLITIARAMLEDAPLLILDEATSSVDTRTEKIISNAIDKLMEGRTSFVIAHRLSTIQNANMILVLKDGDIIETGTHEELMAQGGFYADLYMSQFDTSE